MIDALGVDDAPFHLGHLMFEKVVRSDVQRSAAIDLSFRLIWEKMLPDRFVGIASFASGILAPHIFQGHQRAILTGIGGANCAGNVCQPWRRRFCFELFRCILRHPIQRTDVDEAHAVEHIEHCA